jgi:hypothetical protein
MVWRVNLEPGQKGVNAKLVFRDFGAFTGTPNMHQRANLSPDICSLHGSPGRGRFVAPQRSSQSRYGPKEGGRSGVPAFLSNLKVMNAGQSLATCRYRRMRLMSEACPLSGGL